MSEHELAPLSPRQRQIAELIADGFTNKVICAKLRIAHGTLRIHIRRIADKLNLDCSKDVRVQVTWLVIDARYEENPNYHTAPPIEKDSKAAA